MIDLSADRPRTDPQEDLFGHAPFAKHLANSICRYRGSDGLVVALYGPWGSGKSTVLNYVKHYLEQQPENDRPVVVEFNPWWFSGQEKLARAFLGHLQTALTAECKNFKKLGKLLPEFAESIGGLTDLAGVTGGLGRAIGSLVGKVGKWVGYTERKPKDVPGLKMSISSVLQKADKRILVIIDDIDRLTPEETHKLFTVIKALADFPNVVYFLAFDREVAAQAIEKQVGLPGDRFLEKIVQVPFEIPRVDLVALRETLFKHLDEVLNGWPDELFDRSYLENVYHSGIRSLIQVPRDVVRLTNALTVTYPSVRGEVNPVDFIALESLRVFLPELYDFIRVNPERFTGYNLVFQYQGDLKDTDAFNERWVGKIPEAHRASTRSLVELIFPRISQHGHASGSPAELRRNLRVCHHELFPIYFRLTTPPGTIRHSEMVELLDLAGMPDKFGNFLVKAKDARRPDGLSKAQALLVRLMDHVEEGIPDARIPSVIQSLLDVGDELIEPANKYGKFDLDNLHRVSRPVNGLLERVGAERRVDVLGSAIRSGNAVAVQLSLLWILEAKATGATDSGESALLSTAEVDELKSDWLSQVRALSEKENFLKHPELRRLLKGWQQWGGEAEVRVWCEEALKSDEILLIFLSGFLQFSSSGAIGDSTVSYQPQLNPNWLKGYLDTVECADRLRELQKKDEVPNFAQVAVSQYLKEFDMLQEGKNPADADD